MSASRHSLGIDIGGTFTDFSLWREDRGELVALKMPTTREHPVDGVINGLERLQLEYEIDLGDIGSFVHGTTIALNTLVQRDGAKLGLLVTKGFRDLLVIQRLRMPTPYDWYTGRPEPLLPRRHVFEIAGRLGPDGDEEEPLSDDDIDRAADKARAAGLDGLVICFMHAYGNPMHERRAAERIAAKMPSMFVCCSHAVWPRMREYERALISILNAYVMPRVDSYLGELEARLTPLGVSAKPFITQSAGGIVSASSARRNPVDTLLSGPAAGVMGAVHVARQVGVRNFVTLDIGGTSADVAFVENGTPRISQNEHIADFPLLMPVIGVSSIGAGGGSVIAVDEMGMMRVGPASVGAEPGPACYGRGGDLPAVTDALLAGGFVSPETFAGGHMRLQPERADAVLAPLSERLKRTKAETVEAVIQVATSSIFAEFSNLAAKQGVSPADYALLPFGGGGPLFAAFVAKELGISRIVVPVAPGTLCSLGAMLSNVSKPFVRSIIGHLDDVGHTLKEALVELQAEALAWLEDESPKLMSHTFETAADMRYVGQSFEIDVPVDPRLIESGDRQALAAAFHRRHKAMFAHADEQAAVEIVDLRLTIVGETQKPVIEAAVREAGGELSPYTTRDVVVDGAFRPVPIYRREALPLDSAFDGPAVVEQGDTTTYVPPGWRASVHTSGTLILESIKS